MRFAVTWRHHLNFQCYDNLTPPITIVLLSCPRHLQATGTDPGTSDTTDASFSGSVSEYLHRRDVLIPCKHHSITSIIIIITDTLKTEINFNYATKTLFVPRSKHSVSVIKTSQLMLYREIMAVCSQIHTKHKYAVWAERRIAEC